ncbi:hypothetical protein HY251_09430 [bacterium]|nr:hypothetical protein [bacterium]
MNLGVLVEESPRDERGSRLRACAERTEEATRGAMGLIAQLLALHDDTERELDHEERL